MRAFESEVQWIRYEVLKKVIQKTIEGTLEEKRYALSREIIPGNTPISRCCVYKERAIVEERIDLILEGIKQDEGIIHTIDSACDECSSKRYMITDSCRGCFARRCIQTCKKGAIEKKEGRAYINYDKCVSCGRCKEVCPFNAIVDALKPCIRACKSKAIHIKENQTVEIDYSKCSSCGACVYQCPFGALSDRSEIVKITQVIEAAKKGEGNVYAVIAPAIVTQYNAKIGQIVAAIKQIGFKDVIEAALGADIVAYQEGLEFIERVVRGKEICMMTSCCPAFVDYVKTHYEELSGHISTLVSPMMAISRLIRQMDPKAQVIFIGPCMAKKQEKLIYDQQGDETYVMTFEELEALIDAYEIKMEDHESQPLNNASYYGRLFARSGGVTEAVATIIEKEGLEKESYRPLACNGIEEIDKALKMLKAKKNTFNFIEGMACIGGCIGGAACLIHDQKQGKKVEAYAKGALEENIGDALRVLGYETLNLHRPNGDKLD